MGKSAVLVFCSGKGAAGGKPIVLVMLRLYLNDNINKEGSNYVGIHSNVLWSLPLQMFLDYSSHLHCLLGTLAGNDGTSREHMLTSPGVELPSLSLSELLMSIVLNRRDNPVELIPVSSAFCVITSPL